MLNPYIGTEKEMKRKVAEFAARLKQAKERTLLDQPRQRKPTEKALQLEKKRGLRGRRNHKTASAERKTKTKERKKQG